jgi:3-methyladenine DNA glycosylase AlkD
MLPDTKELVERVSRTQHGFGDVKLAAQEVMQSNSLDSNISLATGLLDSEAYQARMLATFILGMVAARSDDCLRLMRGWVSLDPDWRVQEILAQAFNQYCSDIGYENALPTIESWLGDDSANVRRAAAEGPRIWTSRPYFKTHPEKAIALLSALRADESDYVRKSVGNALRDISRKHAALVGQEVAGWDINDKRIAHTYKLASRFIDEKHD